MAGMESSELRAFARELSTMSQEAEPRAKLVVTKGLTDIQAGAQMRAPVDTGYLRSSVTREVNGLEGVVGPTAHYGVYQEMGTSRMAAQPFLWPAAQSELPRIEQAFLQVMGLR